MRRRFGAIRDRFKSWGPPPPTPDGTMSLYDHLRELRYRVVIAVIAVAVTTLIAAFFYRSLVALVVWPYNVAVVQYKQFEGYVGRVAGAPTRAGGAVFVWENNPPADPYNADLVMQKVGAFGGVGSPGH